MQRSSMANRGSLGIEHGDLWSSWTSSEVSRCVLSDQDCDRLPIDIECTRAKGAGSQWHWLEIVEVSAPEVDVDRGGTTGRGMALVLEQTSSNGPDGPDGRALTR